MSQENTFSLFNPLPFWLWALVLAIVGVEAALLATELGLVAAREAIGWRLELVQHYGFSGSLFEWMLENRRFPPEHLLRLISYPFIHGDPVHTLFVVVFVLALGRFVSEGMSGLAMIVVFLAASATGAAAWGWAFGSPSWLFGGYPGVFGLVGAFTYLLWIALGRSGANRARAFLLIGLLLLLRFLVGLYQGMGSVWLADLAGFATGFGLSFVLAPGGWARLLGLLRRR
ncbi:rhomboid family intramembrane serine protease [Alkalilacustris brevis]|uniref:rhomboid family intramembrane serine protease n=1 Tax=Alkalilacustris brevis TaxID=2026338 RepID=UPI000E0D85BE|nr:rhomboid family intramembrane serine protease [Alkalilacustris brevis]